MTTKAPTPPAAATRFTLHGKTYSAVGPADMTVKMHLELEQETADFGRRITLAEFERMSAEYNEHLKLDGAPMLHPSYLWLMGIAVWAAKKMAGEDVTFADAIDFSPTDLKAIPEPQDHKAKSAKSAPRKARPAKKAASGRAGARRAAAADSPSQAPPNSEPES